MKDYEDEILIRLVLFQKDFSEALRYFEKSKELEDDFVRDALLKAGIISYCRPFLKNTGINKEVKRFHLPSKFVPKDYQWLHEMFLNYRGNFIGHSNFKTMKPNIGAIEDTPKGGMVPIRYTSISFDHWFERDAEFPEEPPLINLACVFIRELSQKIPESITNEEVFKSEK